MTKECRRAVLYVPRLKLSLDSGRLGVYAQRNGPKLVLILRGLRRAVT
jgi:hypothetical protein